jgi:hypothetical protein
MRTVKVRILPPQPILFLIATNHEALDKWDRFAPGSLAFIDLDRP